MVAQPGGGFQPSSTIPIGVGEAMHQQHAEDQGVPAAVPVAVPFGQDPADRPG
ncbi:hypothetical protein ACQP1W_19245 [Spirillospora sp. CA-255316]